MKTITLKGPDDLDARLESVLRSKGATKSAFIREAIDDYCSRSGNAGAGSFLDLGKDLAGCINGPADLSVGKKHLKGYGR